ncbi:unnamed protein product [Acanthoscelides obtectus]|uniref:FAS1 domain-containing protein n=1 Tax=Acanthoscelides obtectus TaxID=200917 RepID=A0A9P0Q8N1_ACAOB|nr:unnamed protein product [Acanthoscelides obtectus]CAK1648783.1 Fasciclin-1 [Acanthoscelides obtectus]
MRCLFFRAYRAVPHLNNSELPRPVIVRPFPFLNILTKLSSDPDLDYIYTLGESTGFNDILHREDLQFTYFVTTDRFWNMVKQEGLKQVEKDLDILKRHLVIAQKSYTIEKLVDMSKVDYYFTNVDLPTENGVLRIMVREKDGQYYLIWRNKLMHVLKPNYMCTNGIVHIISGPFTIFDDPHEKKSWTVKRNFLEKLITVLKVTFASL